MTRESLRRTAGITLVLAWSASCYSEQPAPTDAPSIGSPRMDVVSPSPNGDTYLNTDNVNYSTVQQLNLYTWPDNQISNAIVMKFDLSSIPAGSTISSATLNLYLFSSDATADPTYTATVHKIVNKNPVIASATGDTYDGVNPWTSTGQLHPLAQGDIGPAVASLAIDKTQEFKHWDVTSLVQGWLASPSTNFGLLVNSDPSKLRDHWRFFRSSEYTVTGQRPSLSITYTPPTPGTVSDLRVTSVTNNSATLAFTEVNDGTGQPAKYDVRFAVTPISWGSASSVTQGTCSTPVTGTSIGATHTCTVLGLSASTSYDFQLVAFRGTLNVDAVFGGLSNTAQASTAAGSGGSGDEPVFDPGAGQSMVLEDVMDQYTTPEAMDVGPPRSFHPVSPTPAHYAVIVPGRGGAGKGLSLIYDASDQNLPWWLPPDGRWYPDSTLPFVIQYWFRISKNGGPGGSPGFGSTANGMKWFEFWVHLPSGLDDRSQLGVTLGDPTTGPLWHMHAAQSAELVGFQPVGPYWNDVNNNQWHRVTYLYQPNSTAGGTDGIARMWIDGTKIVDVSAAAAGVVPTGGTHAWCSTAEVGQLDIARQITEIHLGDNLNGGSNADLPMTLDFDDFRFWVMPARIQ